jgi:hypothetical protein
VENLTPNRTKGKNRRPLSPKIAPEKSEYAVIDAMPRGTPAKKKTAASGDLKKKISPERINPSIKIFKFKLFTNYISM